MTDTFTTQDLIAELQEYHQPIADRQPGGVTADEWSVAQNISIKLARRQLKKLASDGVLVEEHCRLAPRSMGYVYYKTP